MPSLPLVGFTTCSQRDEDNRFYCVAGAQKDCRESGVGRIRFPSRDSNKNRQHANISFSFTSDCNHNTTQRTTSTIAGSTARATKTASSEASSQPLRPLGTPTISTITTSSTNRPGTFADSPPPPSTLSTITTHPTDGPGTVAETPSSPSASNTITTASTDRPTTLTKIPSSPSTSNTIPTIPTDIPETPATYIKVLEGQAPPTNSGLSTDAKAGIVVNIAIALILTLGIGVVIFLLYRRSRQSRCQDTEVNGTSGCKAEELASERVIPEMDAIHSERRAELDGIVISELFGGTMSRTAAEGWRMIAAERHSVHEMGA